MGIFTTYDTYRLSFLRNTGKTSRPVDEAYTNLSSLLLLLLILPYGKAIPGDTTLQT
jgi:hypothetical protein